MTSLPETRVDTIRHRVYRIFNPTQKGDGASRYFDTFLVCLILSNIIAFILQTVDRFYQAYSHLFDGFETVSVVFFSIEYLLRIWSCVENPSFKEPIRGRIRYTLTPYLIVDFLAIAPFFIPSSILDLRVIRVLRLFRFFRVAKLVRYSKALQTIGLVFRERKEELTVTIIIMGMIILISATCMYYIEREAQPENFSSIPKAMWWAVATLTTIGYGDVFPVTLTGRIIGAVIALAGIGMVALPTGILGSGFMEVYSKGKDKDDETQKKVCPHCGKEIE